MQNTFTAVSWGLWTGKTTFTYFTPHIFSNITQIQNTKIDIKYRNLIIQLSWMLNLSNTNETNIDLTISNFLSLHWIETPEKIEKILWNNESLEKKKRIVLSIVYAKWKSDISKKVRKILKKSNCISNRWILDNVCYLQNPYLHQKEILWIHNEYWVIRPDTQLIFSCSPKIWKQRNLLQLDTNTLQWIHNEVLTEREKKLFENFRNFSNFPIRTVGRDISLLGKNTTTFINNGKPTIDLEFQIKQTLPAFTKAWKFMKSKNDWLEYSDLDINNKKALVKHFSEILQK